MTRCDVGRPQTFRENDLPAVGAFYAKPVMPRGVTTDAWGVGCARSAGWDAVIGSHSGPSGWVDRADRLRQSPIIAPNLTAQVAAGLVEPLKKGSLRAVIKIIINGLGQRNLRPKHERQVHIAFLQESESVMRANQ